MSYLFAYGMFKSGGNLSPLFRECTWRGRAQASGFVLLDTGSVASMVPGRDTGKEVESIVKGELIEIPDHRFYYVMKRLDTLRANGSVFIRVQIDVDLEDGRSVNAFTYLRMVGFSVERLLASGSW